MAMMRLIVGLTILLLGGRIAEFPTPPFGNRSNLAPLQSACRALLSVLSGPVLERLGGTLLFSPQVDGGGDGGGGDGGGGDGGDGAGTSGGGDGNGGAGTSSDGSTGGDSGTGEGIAETVTPMETDPVPIRAPLGRRVIKVIRVVRKMRRRQPTRAIQLQFQQ
jgi:hypothetical protein